MKKSKPKCSGNGIPNGDFTEGKLGGLPEGWSARFPRGAQAPVFKLTKRNGKKVLLAGGNGSDDCVGCLTAPVSLRGGRTYRMRVRFEMSNGLDPNMNLLFCVYDEEGFNDGIFRFKRLRGGLVEGHARFLWRGKKKKKAGDVRIFFRLSARGNAWIRSISLEEREPIAPRPVTVVCTNGGDGLRGCRGVLDYAGQQRADLVLLTEGMSGLANEPLGGPSAKLMAAKAKRYKMYVAGCFYHLDKKADRLYNTTLLFGRKGRRIGRYDKNHPYSPELNDMGVAPGRDVPVFKTELGTLGIMTCYDSWFGDVAELLALKGAEIILFPNAGFFRSLMPARAADNCVRIVTSSGGSGHGIWDTTGTEVTAPDADATCAPNHPRTFKNVRKKKVGKIDTLMATLDLSQSPSPHNWGGPMLSAPGGRRNRREQRRLLYADILREVERWWDE